jgi:hypothetical protein
MRLALRLVLAAPGTSPMAALHSSRRTGVLSSTMRLALRLVLAAPGTSPMAALHSSRRTGVLSSTMRLALRLVLAAPGASSRATPGRAGAYHGNWENGRADSNPHGHHRSITGAFTTSWRN